MAQEQSKSGNVVLAKNTIAAIPAAGNTDLLEVDVKGIDQLVVEIILTTQALDAFILQGKIHADSAYITLTGAIVGSATLAPTPVGLIIAASAHTFAALAAGQTAWIIINVTGLDYVKFQASAAVDGANVTIRARGHGAS